MFFFLTLSVSSPFRASSFVWIFVRRKIASRQVTFICGVLCYFHLSFFEFFCQVISFHIYALTLLLCQRGKKMSRHVMLCFTVPKLSSVVTFGFSSLFLSLLSEGRYFRVAKTRTVHGPFEVNKIAANVKTRTLFIWRNLLHY